ncbi:MAG: AAA family ATPase, partial [Bacteroidia bacterium]|nr:AAA family ATPase [Bacteroidia bacterium]
MDNQSLIQKIVIKNFKSIESLEIELGRFNVFIGANGSGKTNILEAVAMGLTAIDTEAEEIEEQLFYTRGMRLTEPKFMKAAF